MTLEPNKCKVMNLAKRKKPTKQNKKTKIPHQKIPSLKFMYLGIDSETTIARGNRDLRLKSQPYDTAVQWLQNHNHRKTWKCNASV